MIQDIAVEQLRAALTGQVITPGDDPTNLFRLNQNIPPANSQLAGELT